MAHWSYVTYVIDKSRYSYEGVVRRQLTKARFDWCVVNIYLLRLVAACACI